MNKRQKEVIKSQLTEEEKELKKLKRIYSQASKDCAQKIAELSSRKDMENLQSIIYQKKYQETLKKQIDGVLKDLQSNSYTGLSDYMSKCYQSGYVGAMYDLHGQGIPLVTPIDQKQVQRAINTNSKISEGLYSRLGEDTKYLKKSINAELSRGIANGSSWNDMASHIANGMNSPFNRAKSNAMRIARTEGHRIQMESQMDALQTAKSKGADVVKQWDASLDDVTRDTHAELDGQIRELDEDFVIPSTGASAPAPSMFGDPAEDCNCRCCVTQRARWMLDEDELAELEDRAEYFGLDKTSDFEEFKQTYLGITEEAIDEFDLNAVLKTPVESDDPEYSKLLKRAQENYNIKYKPVENHTGSLSQEEIIKAISGGDTTKGSCASVGLTYIGQQQGWNVLDFRDGMSRKFFSSSINLDTLSQMKGMKVLKAEGKSSLVVGNRLLKQVEEGKEYYLCVGRHASIVRKHNGQLQYLELQSSLKSGWIDFKDDVKRTLSWRFDCSKTYDKGASELYDFMIDINESNFNTKEFKSLLGFLNTAKDKQRKGGHGSIK